MSTQRVLIVESQAHVPGGHFPVMFAELAVALTDEGRAVDVLTSRGWAPAAEPDVALPIYRLNRVLLVVYVGINLLNRIPPKRRRWLATASRDAIMALSARRLCKKLGADEVIMTSMATDPWIWALLIGRRRVVLYQFESPSSRPWAVIRRMAERTERRRRERGGGRVRIAVNSEQPLADWRSQAPSFDAVRFTFTGSRSLERVSGSRERLGLAPTERVALLFGSPHDFKDPGTVWRAFAQLPGWTLVIAGAGGAEAYREWRARQTNVVAEPVLFDGFAGEETRRDLHSSADLVVLSFTHGATIDSGTLNDAISYGIPVVASSPGFVADSVSRLELGTTFDAGDPDSLIEAVLRAPSGLSDEVVASARDATSMVRVARRHLAAIERRTCYSRPGAE